MTLYPPCDLDLLRDCTVEGLDLPISVRLANGDEPSKVFARVVPTVSVPVSEIERARQMVDDLDTGRSGWGPLGSLRALLDSWRATR